MQDCRFWTVLFEADLVQNDCRRRVGELTFRERLEPQAKSHYSGEHGVSVTRVRAYDAD